MKPLAYGQQPVHFFHKTPMLRVGQDFTLGRRMESFSVRCIFEWNKQPNQKKQHLYEERITLWRASSIEAAMQMAEKEAIEYATEYGFTLVHLLQGYALQQTVNVTCVEVFSLLRESDLDPHSYLDTFFDSGTERERQIT